MNRKTFLELLDQKTREAEGRLAAIENTSASIWAELEGAQNDLREIKNTLANINVEYLKLTGFRDGKKKVLICGFYGGDNIGDELMLETLIEYLKQINVEISIMLTRNKGYNIDSIKEFKIIHYPETEYDLDILLSYYDVVIFGGGALIDSRTYQVNLEAELGLTTILIDLTLGMLHRKKEVYWIGLSSEWEFRNELFVQRLKEAIETITYVSLRDENSLKTIEKYGIDCEGVRIIDDIVVANKYFQEVQDKDDESKNIGVVLICSQDLREKNLLILTELVAKYPEYTINLIPFYDYVKNDYNEYQFYKTKISRLNVHEFRKDFKYIVDLFNEQDLLVAGRYHATLIASLLNKKTIAFVYDQHRHYKNKMSYIKEKYDPNLTLIPYSEVNNGIGETIKSVFNKKKEKIDFTDVFRCAEEGMDEVIKEIEKEKI